MSSIPIGNGYRFSDKIMLKKTPEQYVAE
jgi:hypothetical protein